MCLVEIARAQTGGASYQMHGTAEKLRIHKPARERRSLVHESTIATSVSYPSVCVIFNLDALLAKPLDWQMSVRP